jgi:hypothetical protein
MTLAALSQGCPYGEDENGNCLMGPPVPQQACPFGTDTSGNCIMGPLAPGQVPTISSGIPSLPTTGAAAGTTAAPSSPSTAIYLIGGAILLAFMLK